MFDNYFKTKYEKKQFFKNMIKVALDGNAHDSLVANLFITSVLCPDKNENEKNKKETKEYE